MRIALVLTAFIGICGNTAAGPPSEHCTAVTGRVASSLGSLRAEDMRAFLRLFSDPRCKGSVEFAEFGNETIFKAIEKRPALFFTALFALSEPEIAAVRKEIDDPGHDCINVARSYEAVQRDTRMPADLKQRALGFVELAYEQQKRLVGAWEAQNGKKWDWGECRE